MEMIPHILFGALIFCTATLAIDRYYERKQIKDNKPEGNKPTEN